LKAIHSSATKSLTLSPEKTTAQSPEDIVPHSPEPNLWNSIHKGNNKANVVATSIMDI
jgi:hypothetical protein